MCKKSGAPQFSAQIVKQNGSMEHAKLYGQWNFFCVAYTISMINFKISQIENLKSKYVIIIILEQ